ncbi:EamA family transporter [Aquella oligotrophica]|uniref:EamA domain-containing protein n=1 Tax=Aquella oligotrophica TaxID=2067065 RepID=A0A2I7N308_9NEIS|nr:EamA family transporter [Aquella oligotrophica]AUR50822.1 hypothetical protein CUN60_00415 [Aquella oligotrophica]
MSINTLPKWLIFSVASASFAALTAIFGKIGVSHINSNLATFIRTIVILIVSGLIITSRNEWQKISFESNSDMLFLVLSGITTGLSWLCYYRALQCGPASKVAPIDKLSVAITIALSILILKEQFSWSIILGGALIIAGSLVIAIF